MPSLPRPIALITGASAGLGREFAEQLAREGYDLVLVSRNEERLRSVALELAKNYGTSAEVLAADLTRDQDIRRVVERIDRAPPDVLVNNAGFGTRGSIAKTSREGQDAMLRLHVLAVHHLTQAAVQGMVARGNGSIIIVSSVASYLGSAGNVNYNATKTWQRVYVESLAIELRTTGVHVQALCPGYTHTEFHQRGGMDKTRVPSSWWLDGTAVVAESIANMKKRGPAVVVPSLRYKLIVLALRFLPDWVKRPIIALRRR
jgi:short-subunit dehydrogenase